MRYYYFEEKNVIETNTNENMQNYYEIFKIFMINFLVIRFFYIMIIENLLVS
jgi:hypothetical protein